MNYRVGNNAKIKEIGQTVELTCPNCNKKVNFSVFSNKEMEIVPEFPIVKNSTVFFLICPSCAKAYGVAEDIGKNFKKGEMLSIGNYSLKELKEFKAFEK